MSDAKQLLDALISAEEMERMAKSEKHEMAERLDKEIETYQQAQKDLIRELEVLMPLPPDVYQDDTTGEVNVIYLESDQPGMKFKLCYQPSRGKVEVADIEAVPDEFKRVKVEPDKKAINDWLKEQESIPNWVKFYKGKSRLTYKLVKES